MTQENEKNNTKKIYYEYNYILDSLSKESNEILSENEKILNNSDSLQDALDTIERISRNKNYDMYMDLINSAPIFLFRRKVEKLISYLLGLGLNENEIVELLCTSFNKCIELSEKAKDNMPITDEKYFEIASKCKDEIKNGNISPESYKVRVKRIMNEHDELLRRLK